MRRSLLPGVLALIALPAVALDPARAMTQYAHDVWRDRDGLPQNTVQAIVQTRDGYLWLGTEAGLARFDGVRFTVFDRKNTPELRHDHVLALSETRDGSLWIGTRRGGLTRLRAGGFTTFTTADGLPNNTVRTLCEDASGRLWVGTNGGLSSYEAGRFLAHPSSDRLPGGGVRALWADGDGSLWVGTVSGLAHLSGTSVATYTRRSGLRNESVRAIRRGRDGSLWVGTEGGGLHRFRDGRIEVFDAGAGLRSDLVRAIAEDRDGNLWVGTDDTGIRRLADARFASLGRRDGLSSDIVKAIYEDREGSLWIGTEGGGLDRLKNGKVTTYTTREGLSNDFLRAILEDRRGVLWIGTEGGGLNRLENGRFRSYTTRDGLSSNFVTALFEDGRGDLWVGTEDGGLSRKTASGFETFRTAHGLPDDSVWAIEGEPDGSLWVGTSLGLSVLRQGAFTNHTARDGLPGSWIVALHRDRRGDLWVGFRYGALARRSGGRFVAYGAAQGFPAVEVSSFHEESDGTLWIATDGGLVRWRDGRFTTFTTREGLVHDTLFAVLEDAQGRLWISSSKGIFAIPKSELEAVAAGRAKFVSPLALTTADGLEANQCTGDAQPAGWRRRSGRLWFPSVAGAVEIDPQGLAFNRLAPPVHVEGLTTERGAVPLDRPARLPPGTQDLTIRYTALSLLSPEKVRFRYRLEGYDSHWIDAGSRREVQYTSLPAGDYSFRVIASNDDGVWNEAGAQFGFSLLPRFHETRSFAVLCVALAGVLAWAAHRLHVRRVRHDYEVALHERFRIAREIHDTLLQGLAGVTMQLEAVAQGLLEKPGEAKRQLERVLLRIDGCLTDARRSIRGLRTPELEQGNLVAALREASRRCAGTSSAEAELAVSGEPRRLPGDVETSLLRIAQEALANALKYSGARRILVKLAYEARTVRLSVEDDGRGFPEPIAGSGVAGHYGLQGMRERAEQLGGALMIVTAEGAGTRIEVRIPTGLRGLLRWRAAS